MKKSLSIWNKFVALPGAFVNDKPGIASECAIATVIKIMDFAKPHHIIEYGAGIGTFTYTVLSSAKDQLSFYTIENNSFCIEQLNKNLYEFAEGYTLVEDEHGVSSEIKFDFMIVDGGSGTPGDASDNALEDKLAKGAIVIVEGSRLPQRERLLNAYEGRPYSYVKIHPYIKLKSNKGVVSNKGCHVYMFEPKISLVLYFKLYSLYTKIRSRLTNR